MAKNIKLDIGDLKVIRTVDPKLASYNVEMTKDAEQYVLDGNGNMRSTVMYLNGKPLTLGENDELPALTGERVSGTVELAPGSCAFFVL